MKVSTGRKVFTVFNVLFMLIVLVFSAYPFLNQIALSFSGTSAVSHGDVTLIPVDFTFHTYSSIMKDSMFLRNYWNTIVYTVVGTIISLCLTTMASYALSKKLIGGRAILLFFVFTMFFGAGLIPYYLWIKKLNIDNTIWAMVLPNAILPYHVLLMRAYFQGLPHDLEEAAKIDGLSQTSYFLRIVIPLSKPIIATTTLFISVIYWNDWFSALLYMDQKEAQPITLYLRNVMMGTTMAAQSGTIDPNMRSMPQSLQAASMLLVTIPVLCIYPFVQKHFVKGVMIGAVKG